MYITSLCFLFYDVSKGLNSNSGILSISFVGYTSSCPELTHIACNSTVKNPVCVSYSQICDYHRDCPGGEDESDCLAYKRCDFQKDMCDWRTSKQTLYEWKRFYNHSTYRITLLTGSVLVPFAFFYVSIYHKTMDCICSSSI